MIKRMNVVKGVGRFIELNPTSGTKGDFVKLNVIYALNGCGKSTICDVFRAASKSESAYIMGRKRIGYAGEQEVVLALEDGTTVRYQDATWHGHENCPTIYVFDDRFTSENVLIGYYVGVEQRRNLYGLVIGDQGAALKAAVDVGEKRLTDATTAHKTAEQTLTSLIPDGYTFNSFRALPRIEDLESQIESLGKELDSAQKTKSKADSIKARPSLPVLPFPEVPENLRAVLESTLDSAALSAEKKILEHLDTTSKGLSITWVKQGHEAKTGDACPHCGQDMQGLEILDAYQSYFSGELQTQVKSREELEKSVRVSFGESAQIQLRKILESHNTEQTWWKDAAGFDFKLPSLYDPNKKGDDAAAIKIDVDDLLQFMIVANQALTASLGRKKANPGSAIQLSEDEETALLDWNKTVKNLKVYNEEIRSINNGLNDHKVASQSINLVPLQNRLIHLSTTKKRYDQSVVEAIMAFDAAVEEKSKAQEAKTQANKALREQSDEIFERYGARINELLELFGVEFRVVSRGVDFKGMQPSGTLAVELLGTQISSTPDSAKDPSQISLANTLSGGDRSALALAYFLARVESDPDVTKAIVVFDDPYNHQDRSRRQVTIEQIHNIADHSKQSFVLSHDLEFARTVAKKSGTQTKTYELQSVTNPATLEAHALPLIPSQAYEKDYYLLCDYLENRDGQLKHLKEIAVTLRVILEGYLRYKFPRSWGENDWLGDMIRKIRDAQAGDPLMDSQSLVEELSNINTYSKRFHHGSLGEQADMPDARELSTYVKRTLDVIHKG